MIPLGGQTHHWVDGRLIDFDNTFDNYPLYFFLNNLVSYLIVVIHF